MFPLRRRLWRDQFSHRRSLSFTFLYHYQSECAHSFVFVTLSYSVNFLSIHTLPPGIFIFQTFFYKQIASLWLNSVKVVTQLAPTIPLSNRARIITRKCDHCPFQYVITLDAFISDGTLYLLCPDCTRWTRHDIISVTAWDYSQRSDGPQ